MASLSINNQNISTIHQLADWLVSKGDQPSAISKINYHLAGRIALLGASLVSLAEAVGRALLGTIGLMGYWMTLGQWQYPSSLGVEQMEKASQAGSISLNCFCSILSPRELANRLNTLEPTELDKWEFTPEMRNWRIRKGADLIERKLQAQLNRANSQEAKEADKGFVYLRAPQNFRGESHTERGVGFEAGVCHFIGKRPTMEDEHLATSFNLKVDGKMYPVQLFGIFDGHGGGEASIYMRQNLEPVLRETLNKFCSKGLTDEAIWNALKITFVELSARFKSPTSGTTATVAMVLDGKLWTANVGDSRTILANGVQLSEDTKPEDSYYKRGIEHRGGGVFWGRVNGRLAVARAIGDHDIGAINSRPKITAIPMNQIPKGTRLILACDGIYDVASTRQVAAGVRKHKGQSVEQIARDIVYSAYVAQSRDNLSALVISLNK